MGKEPWKYSESTGELAGDYLRLRHKLIPYLYSMNYLTSHSGKALIEPMYYAYDEPEARRHKNQYLFGTGLVVSPVTKRTSRKTHLAKTELWVPEERYTDIFTGRIYKKGKYKIYRDLKYIPVFARPGTILPMYRSAEDNSIDMLKPLDIKLYRGNGTFKLYLDEGDGLGYMDGKFVVVNFELSEKGDKLTLKLSSEGDKAMLSSGLDIRLLFEDALLGELSLSGTPTSGQFLYKGEELLFELTGFTAKTNAPRRELLIDTISRYQMLNDPKEALFKPILNGNYAFLKLIPACYRGPVEEILKISD